MSGLPPEPPEGYSPFKISVKMVLFDLFMTGVLYAALVKGFDASPLYFTLYLIISVFAIVSAVAPYELYEKVPTWHFQAMIARYSSFKILAYHWATEIVVLYLLYLNSYWLTIVMWVIVQASFSTWRGRQQKLLDERLENEPNQTGPGPQAGQP